ncbi:hypothetical protein JTE90_025312 [Oedothorax gibbosus]|uniref:C2H2-type domain-containing protein n=1 Tax=Oedothorax gibbosus TaxID=931172 RepID=A0AAV6V8W1_9ARAC|nr:hypothetical protein JTE90_025312 [Oedothorax gibbosus]
MPAWKSDLSGMDFLTGTHVDCKVAHSSDDDSVDSVPWLVDDSFEDLDAYLHENPPGWSPHCECEDSRLSVCSFCLSNSSSDGLCSLPLDDIDRFDLFSSFEQIQDPVNFLDRLYPELHERDDLVVLGVDLPALASCQDSHHPPYTTTTNTNIQNTTIPIDYNNNPAVQQQDYRFSHNQRTAPASQQWYSSLGSVVPGGFNATNTKPAPAQQRQRRGPGGRRAVPEEEKIFPCPYAGCARVYSKNSHLRAHLRRHTGEKPFVCQWPGCKWRFSRSDELARHKRSHSGVKPYQCTICGKRFGRSDHLAKHVRIHRKQGYAIPVKNSKASPAVKVQILSPRA